MLQVQFIGSMGKTFGTDPIEVRDGDFRVMWAGLERKLPEFKRKMRSFQQFALLKRVNGQIVEVPPAEWGFGFGNADLILFAPRVEGSAAAAAAYVAEALATYGSIAYAAAYIVTYVAVTYAISYASNAVLKALSDSPNTSANSSRSQSQSYIFNGAQNSDAQGEPIQVNYGRHRVGAVRFSEDISSDQMAMTMNDTYTLHAGEPFTGNVTSNDILRERLTVTSWTLDGTTYSPGDTLTVASTSHYVEVGGGEGGSTLELVSDQNGYSVTLAADGSITIDSENSAHASLSGTYTATDSTTGSTATAALRITISPVAVWTTNAGPGATSDGTGPGGGVSAGDATSGDGGTGGGDGSGSGGTSATA